MVGNKAMRTPIAIRSCFFFTIPIIVTASPAKITRPTIILIIKRYSFASIKNNFVLRDVQDNKEYF